MSVEESAENLFAAWQSGAEPALPSELDPTMEEPAAYAVQAAYVHKRLRGDGIAGFKVGATQEAIRDALNLENPLTGVLFESGSLRSGATVPLEQFRSLLIETEIGFCARSVIDAPIRDEQALRAAVNEMFPVFELADTGFYGSTRSAGTDMIAANSACGGLVQGASCSPETFDPDAQSVALYRDDELVYQAPSSETLGGSQWHSLRWLVNTMVSQGYRIEPGHIFLTGALGRPQRGRIGHYRADYGPLGSVEFELV